MKNNILALWNFPPLCCWHLLFVLLRTFFFEFFCFFFFFDRMLVSVDALGHSPARLKPELKRTHVETNVPCKLTVTARTIFPPPHKAQIDSEGESQGRHLDTGGGFTRKHDQPGPEWPTPLHLGPTKTSATDLARSRSVRIGVVRFLKKVWSPTCPLNGSFQSPNCPLKGFFHSPNGIF